METATVFGLNFFTIVTCQHQEARAKLKFTQSAGHVGPHTGQYSLAILPVTDIPLFPPPLQLTNGSFNRDRRSLFGCLGFLSSDTRNNCA